MHRVILNPPKGFSVDHKNGNGLDNRRSNLRIATASLNGANRKNQGNNSSGFKGVDFKKGKWRARIAHKKKRYELGFFATKEEAAAMYMQAAQAFFGDYATELVARKNNEIPNSLSR